MGARPDFIVDATPRGHRREDQEERVGNQLRHVLAEDMLASLNESAVVAANEYVPREVNPALNLVVIEGLHHDLVHHQVLVGFLLRRPDAPDLTHV